MTLRAIIFILILAIGIVANGCATKPSNESRNGAGKSSSIGSTNTTQIPIAVLVNCLVETKMSEIEPALNLTTRQKTEIREILTRQAITFFESLSNILQGELSRQEFDEAVKQQVKYTAQIKSLLTLRQAAAYDELKKKQLAQDARDMAATRLQQLQTPLQLKSNQLDGVFAILASQAETHLSNLETNTALTMNNYAPFDYNTEAFRDVLTPEQVKRYKKLRHPEQSSFQRFLQAVGPGCMYGFLINKH
jgi:hypothetical protein